MKSFISLKTITLKAYETRPEAVTGSILFVKKATGPFNISLDGWEWLPCAQGIKIGEVGGESFRSVNFQNTANAPLTITYYAGSVNIDFYPDASQRNAPTVNVGSGVLSVTGLTGVAVPFPGTLNGLQRKSIVIQNLDLNVTLIVRDSPGGNICAEIDPDNPYTVESSGYFEVLSGAAGPTVSNFVVLEIYYLA